MEQNIKETYTKDGKSLALLIQEWINENNFLLYCKEDKRDIEFTYVDKK